MTEQTNPSQPRSRIVIEFLDSNEMALSYEGKVTAYMMHGAAGVIRAQADANIQMAIANQMQQGIEVARDIPRSLKQ